MLNAPTESPLNTNNLAGDVPFLSTEDMGKLWGKTDRGWAVQSLSKCVLKEKGPFLIREFSMKNVAAGSGTNCHRHCHIGPHPPLPASS